MQANCRKGGQGKQIEKERQDSLRWKILFHLQGVDEEKEVIEKLGGNLPVHHHRKS